MDDTVEYVRRTPGPVLATVITRTNFARLAEQLGAQVKLPVSDTTLDGPAAHMSIPVRQDGKTQWLEATVGMALVTWPDGRMTVMHAGEFDREWRLARPTLGYAPNDPRPQTAEDVAQALVRAGVPPARIIGPWSVDAPAWNLEANGFVILSLSTVLPTVRILVTVTDVAGLPRAEDPAAVREQAHRALEGEGFEFLRTAAHGAVFLR